MNPLTTKFLNWRNNKVDYYSHRLKENKTHAEKVFHPLAIHLGAKYKDRPKFQYVIHINQLRKYIIDFYFPLHKIAIEIDGEIHSTDYAKFYDARRTRHLNSKGISVLRFTNPEVIENMEKVRNTVFDYFSIHPLTTH